MQASNQHHRALVGPATALTQGSGPKAQVVSTQQAMLQCVLSYIPRDVRQACLGLQKAAHKYQGWACTLAQPSGSFPEDTVHIHSFLSCLVLVKSRSCGCLDSALFPLGRVGGWCLRHRENSGVKVAAVGLILETLATVTSPCLDQQDPQSARMKCKSVCAYVHTYRTSILSVFLQNLFNCHSNSN